VFRRGDSLRFTCEARSLRWRLQAVVGMNFVWLQLALWQEEKVLRRGCRCLSLPATTPLFFWPVGQCDVRDRLRQPCRRVGNLLARLLRCAGGCKQSLAGFVAFGRRSRIEGGECVEARRQPSIHMRSIFVALAVAGSRWHELLRLASACTLEGREGLRRGCRCLSLPASHLCFLARWPV